MQTVAHHIDRILSWLKWPFALAAGLLTIPATIALVRIVELIVASHFKQAVAIFSGATGYIILWLLVLRRTKLTFFTTLEHELTHAVFALLTFHPVTGIRSTLRGGGHMTFKGEGNWLITIAPYFVPTFCLTVCLFTWIMPVSTELSTAFGVALGYHTVSTYHETHRHQTDLKKVGFIFAFMVLPFANVFMLAWTITLFFEHTPLSNLFVSQVTTAIREVLVKVHLN